MKAGRLGIFTLLLLPILGLPGLAEINTQLEWNDGETETITLDWKRTAEWIMAGEKTKVPVLQVSVEIPRHLLISLKDQQQASLIQPKSPNTSQILKVNLLSKRTAIRVIKRGSNGQKKNVSLTLILTQSPPLITVAQDCKREGMTIQASTTDTTASTLSAHLSCQSKNSRDVEVRVFSPQGLQREETLNTSPTSPTANMQLTNRFDPSDQLTLNVQLVSLQNQPQPKTTALTPLRMSPAPPTTERSNDPWRVWTSLAAMRAEYSHSPDIQGTLLAEVGVERKLESIQTPLRFALSAPLSSDGFFSFRGETVIGAQMEKVRVALLPGAWMGIFHHPTRSVDSGFRIGPALGAEATYDRVSISSRLFYFFTDWKLQSQLGIQVLGGRDSQPWDVLIGHARSHWSTEWSIGAKTYWDFQ